MVGMVNSSSSRERLASLVNSAKSAMDLPSKLESLRQFNLILQQQEDDSVPLCDFLPRLLELQSDQHSPVRKFATEYHSPNPIQIILFFTPFNYFVMLLALPFVFFDVFGFCSAWFQLLVFFFLAGCCVG